MQAPLSESAGGRPIAIVATAFPGTKIHDTDASDKLEDEIWAWASNIDPNPKKLTIGFGGETAADTTEVTIPGESGDVLVIPGKVLKGTGAAARSVTLFAETTVVINVSGHRVRRVSG